MNSYKQQFKIKNKCIVYFLPKRYNLWKICISFRQLKMISEETSLNNNLQRINIKILFCVKCDKNCFTGYLDMAGNGNTEGERARERESGGGEREGGSEIDR